VENNNQENLEKHILKYEQIKHTNLVPIRKLIKLIRVFSGKNNQENLGKHNVTNFAMKKFFGQHFFQNPHFFFP